MRNRYFISSIALSIALAGCSSEPATEAPKPTFHDLMVGKIDPIADEVWAVGNSAIGEQSELVAARMTDESWAQLAASATRLEDAAKELGALDPVVVVRPGEKIADEDMVGGDSAASVQHNIDANTPGMRARAKALADHMARLVSAAKSHNALQAGILINELDGVCESCHLDYWFPSQKALVEQYQTAGIVPTERH